MKLTHLLWIGAAVAAITTFAQAQTSLYSLTLGDVTEDSLNTWAGAMSGEPIHVNLGNGLGTGTISFISINSGQFQVGATRLTAETYDDRLLSNGDILNITEETSFSIRMSIPGAEDNLRGFRMTITLDEGVFPDGSLFIPRSLDYRSDGNRQRIQLVSGLGDPYSDNLPSDTSVGAGATGVLTEISPGVYAPDIMGSVSQGKPFAILSNTNSFTVDFLSNLTYGGGVAMTVATPLIPEPSSALLFSAASLGFVLRRQRRA